MALKNAPHSENCKCEWCFDQLQAELDNNKKVIDDIYDKTVEGYIIELIDILRGDAVRGEDGTADYSTEKECKICKGSGEYREDNDGGSAVLFCDCPAGKQKLRKFEEKNPDCKPYRPTGGTLELKS